MTRFHVPSYDFFARVHIGVDALLDAVRGPAGLPSRVSHPNFEKGLHAALERRFESSKQDLSNLVPGLLIGAEIRSWRVGIWLALLCGDGDGDAKHHYD